jgi:hypothetical protein
MSWESTYNTKRSTMIGIGAKIEEMIESAEGACKEAKGAKDALRKHAETLLSVISGADKAVGSTSEDGIKDLETLALVKMWMGKMIISTQNSSRNFRNLEMQAIGEAAGHRRTHDLIIKLIKQEEDRKKNIDEGIEKGDIVVDEFGELEAKPDAKKRPVGVRPGRLKEQRKKMFAQDEIGNNKDKETNSKKPEKKDKK